jgi:hypothetical protein
MKKIGIYFSGLGHSFVNENVEKYAERLKNEISYETTGISYELKLEEIAFGATQKSTVVTISEKESGKEIYRFYDFPYRSVLTERFNKFPVLLKNFWLFLLVLRKFPLVFFRLFIRKDYSRPFQAVYVFGIFLMIACVTLMMLPATLGVLNSKEFTSILKGARDVLGNPSIPFISIESLQTLSKTIVALTAVLLLLVPNSTVWLTGLATEFVCANDYLEQGLQKQLIQGNIDALVEHITEKEGPCEIHLHAYSFGTIIALDYLYPFGRQANGNARRFCKGLVTIGTPFEFINSYYPTFYKGRNTEMADEVSWINIYSIDDALATNFRTDDKEGEAQFGVTRTSRKPVNINYQVVPFSRGLWAFIMLTSLRAHGMYWDNRPVGQSCLVRVLNEMRNKDMIDIGVPSLVANTSVNVA